MDETKIKQILEELYVIEPGLRGEENLIRGILMKLYETRPNIVADPNFVIALRAMIQNKAAEPSARQAAAKFAGWPLLSGGARRYAIGGLLLALLVLLPGILILNQRTPDSNFAASVDVGERAFGPLAYVPSGAAGGRGGGGVAMEMSAAAPMPPVSDADKSYLAARPQSGGGGGDSMASPLIYPGPDFSQVKYVYDGGEFTVDGDGYVYKKRLGSTAATSLIRALKDFPLNNIKSPVVSDLTFVEDRNFGYMISVNMREGWMSFFQNWEKWPMQDRGCAADAFVKCAEMMNFIPQSEVPADEKIIAISNSFLRDYGINTASYGPAKVQKPWNLSNQYYERNAAGEALLPPDMQVIYPLMIDGSEVYDEWGNLVGINVSVNVRLNRVTNASNIFIFGFDKSKYDLEQDSKKIIELAEKGGSSGDFYIMMNVPGAPENVKTNTVKLGAPKRAYMQFYNENNGKSEVLFSPALVFPVTEIQDKNSWGRENIIVPIVPEIMQKLADRYQNMPRPMPLEMPMPVEGGGSPGSVGPAIEPMPPVVR